MEVFGNLKFNQNELQDVTPEMLLGDPYDPTDPQYISADPGYNETEFNKVKAFGPLYDARFWYNKSTQSLKYCKKVGEVFKVVLVGEGVLGETDFSDGLYTNWKPDDSTSRAIDDLNVVLKALAPSPPPKITDYSTTFNQTGTSGKLSFGAGNPLASYTNHPSTDVDGAYSSSGTGASSRSKKGIFGASQSVSGTINSNSKGNSNTIPYSKNAFTLAYNDNERITMTVNDVVDAATVNLKTGAKTSNLTGCSFSVGSLSYVKFDNGDTFEAFKYRTGSWAAKSSRLGYNYVEITYEDGAGGNTSLGKWEWICDGDTSVADPVDASLVIGAWVQDSSKKLSGITYDTGGHASFDGQVANLYKNTQVTSGGISKTAKLGGQTCDVSNSTQGLSELGSGDRNKIITMSQSNVDYDTTNKRLLEAVLAVTTSGSKTLSRNGSQSKNSSWKVLFDSYSPLADFPNGEKSRMKVEPEHQAALLTSTNYDSGAGSSDFPWNSDESLLSNTGLLIYNARLQYPKRGLNSGNFSAYNSNPNYSTISGERTFYTFFYVPFKFEFSLSVGGSVSVIPTTTALGSNNAVHMEFLVPNVTKVGGITTFKCCKTPFTGDMDLLGCLKGSWNNGGTLSIGTRNTSPEGGGYAVIKVTANENWTGYINSLTLS